MVYDHDVQRTAGVKAEKISKQFGSMWALRDVDLDVPAGTILGLLGHNGAGKTTMLRILTTLAKPTSGRAFVGGHDVATHPNEVRRNIGVAGQAATVDGLLTARHNLEMVGRLYHLSKAEARKRAGELLERVDLADVAHKRVDQFSGGMRRRLDLAAALVAKPPVVFLDEPTTGLDPAARNSLWEVLTDHVKTGATLVLTTQYLEEADRLADQIVVLDHGVVAARGTPAELKARLGGDRLVITVQDLAAAERAVEPFRDGTCATEGKQLVVPVRTGTRLVEVVRALDAAGIDAHDIARREATLDDVFLSIGGEHAA